MSDTRPPVSRLKFLICFLALNFWIAPQLHASQCENLLAGGPLAANSVRVLSNQFKNLTDQGNWSAYRREVREIFAHADALGIEHPASRSIWLPLLYDEISIGRLALKNGFRTTELLAIELKLLELATAHPKDEGIDFYIFETFEDFLRWNPHGARSDTRWRQAWIRAIRSSLAATPNGYDRDEVIYNYSQRADIPHVQMLQERARVLGTPRALQWRQDMQDFIELLKSEKSRSDLEGLF